MYNGDTYLKILVYNGIATLSSDIGNPEYQVLNVVYTTQINHNIKGVYESILLNSLFRILIKKLKTIIINGIRQAPSNFMNNLLTASIKII